MKLSSYYKSQENIVELVTDYKNINEFDKVFISKVFTDTEIPEGILNLSNIEYGGTGFYYDKAPPLPSEIEHIMPDYHLYDNWVKIQIENGVKPKDLSYYTDYSIGYMSRGCIRQCSFCVNKNYKICTLHSTLSEFLDESRPYICLLDDNIFACKNWRFPFNELIASGKRFQFKQGLDERLLTDEKCDILFNKSKWIGDYIFAFDNINDRDIIEKKLSLIRSYTSVTPKFYVFCSYNHDNPDTYSSDFWVKDIEDTFERIKILMKYKCLPYIMRYKDYIISPYKGTYINLARWCNQPRFLKKISYREFCYHPSNQPRTAGKIGSSVKYLSEFEQKYPDIAEKYFDMKYETD